MAASPAQLQHISAYLPRSPSPSRSLTDDPDLYSTLPMLAPLYTGDPRLPLPALYKLPDELWLLILAHIPYSYPWLESPNLRWDEHFLPPSSSDSECGSADTAQTAARESSTSTFQAENRFIQAQFSAWQQTMTAALCVCSGWYVELRPSLDQWVLFRSPAQLAAYVRSRPPVEHLGIQRLDIHYDECFPDLLIPPFLARCSALQQLHMNQLNNYLAVDVPLGLLETLASTAGGRVRSVGFPKRGVPAQALELFARLPGLTSLSIGADKSPFSPAQLAPYLGQPAFGANIQHVRIDLPVLSRASDFLFNHLPSSSLPLLTSVTLTTVETPFRMPSSSLVAQPFSARVVEPFFHSHGAKLKTLQFVLAEPHTHGHLCRLVSSCPHLERLALPACEHTREAAPGWKLGELREVGIGNFMQVNRENALQISDHWRDVVGLVSALTAPGSPSSAPAFPALKTVRLSDVLAPSLLPPQTPGPQVHQTKLARKVREMCAERGVAVGDALGGEVQLEGMGGRWTGGGGGGRAGKAGRGRG